MFVFIYMSQHNDIILSYLPDNILIIIIIIYISSSVGTFCQNRRKCAPQVSAQCRRHSKRLCALLTTESMSCIYRDQGTDGFGGNVGSPTCVFSRLRGRHARAHGRDRSHLHRDRECPGPRQGCPSPVRIAGPAVPSHSVHAAQHMHGDVRCLSFHGALHHS